MLKRFMDSMPKMKKLRLLIDCGEDYINFDTVRTVDAVISRPTIEVTTFGDSYPQYIPSRQTQGTISTEMVYDKRTRFLLDKINEHKPYNIRIEYPTEDVCFDFKGYPIAKQLDYMGSRSLPIVSLDLIQDTELKMYDGIIPKNAYCPNCYAPVTSRYGCCDYCGGWVEWVW